MTGQPQPGDIENDIAVVGMAAHLPGAADTNAFWKNLRGGVSSIKRLSDDALVAAGEDAGRMRHRDYVPYAAALDGFETFDAEFFGLSPKEAAIMDPQHRRFLEVAWEALEDAAHVPQNFEGRIGVYGGCGMGSYFYFNVCSNPALVESTGMFLLRHTGNDKDFLTTRLSHVLDLKGPSVNLQTACSTSLVAVHYAVNALRSGECDMALAGGVTIELPQGRGYLYRENEILSPDGQCHAFDHRAQGTVFGSGAGVVALRRLKDALADGDRIWAVVKGSAVNNDGAQKAGYLAPSVEGQAEAVAAAIASAGVTADTIDYIECHGTGTYLGDPIEVAALTRAFRETTDAETFCRIGSVKTNIGHLDTAAGVASLIKTALALHHKEMPASLGFEAPNPAIAFDGSPFVVNDKLSDWRGLGRPRRAGVNSLGVGGTNAHVILEEAPAQAPSEPSDWPAQILTLSARSKAALAENAARLSAHLRTQPAQSLDDIAWTLKEGRNAFDQRMTIVARDRAEAASALEMQALRGPQATTALAAPEIVFLMPGGGAQYAGMARDLYETEPVFADWMDRGLDHLSSIAETDIRALWLPEDGTEAASNAALRQPSLQLPLIMITEYALAQMWMAWGVLPMALVGHSMGENTAACLAGVIGFEDCIGLVHLRGTLFDSVDPGGMLAVPLSQDAVRARIENGALDLAAANGESACVVSGPDAALESFAASLAQEGIEAQRVAIDVAAHSRMLDPILGQFEAYLESITLNPPQIPIISNRSGAPLTDAEATDPAYWVGHLRNTVLFADCLAAAAGPERMFLEVGPGQVLSALARAHSAVPAAHVLSTLRHPDEVVSDDIRLLQVLGKLWALGVTIDWPQIWGEARRQRVALPTYAFQRQSYFIEPGTAQADTSHKLPVRSDDLTGWGWVPRWVPRAAPLSFDPAVELARAPRETWLFFADEVGVADAAAEKLRASGHRVVLVTPGDAFARVGTDGYRLAPEQGREGYMRLLQDLAERGLSPTRIGHFWLLTEGASHRPGSSFFHRVQEQGFYALTFLAQALADQAPATPPAITVITSGAVKVRGEALAHPSKATVIGPVKVIPREMPGMHIALLDVLVPQRHADAAQGFWRSPAQTHAPGDALVGPVLDELLAEPGDRFAAFRDGRRFERVMRQQPLVQPSAPLPKGGTILITGGFGGVGLGLAQHYAEGGANIVLVSRAPLPPRKDWDAYLARRVPEDPTARRMQAVKRLEAQGARVLVMDGDVSHADRMREIRVEVEQEFGRVTGILHAAGVIRDAPLLSKSIASAEDVFTPKIHGTQVLADVFGDGGCDWIALFSSVSGITAPPGQVDYVAASAFLDAFAQAQAGGKTRIFAIDWGIWAEVGMAADAVAARAGDLPRADLEPVSLPMLDHVDYDAAGNRVFSARYSTDDWFIDEHRTRSGDALLPGAALITLAAHALAAQREPGAFELRDLDILRPLRVEDGRSRDVRVRLRRSEQGYDFDVLGDVQLNGRRGFVATAQGAVSLMAMPRPPALDLVAISARLGPVDQAGPTLLAPAQAPQMQFGPRWQSIERRAIGDGEALATLSLPQSATDDGCLLHPALFDVATGWAMALIDGWQPSHLWAPVRYGRVRVHGPLPRRIVSWVRNARANRADRETASFDITLCAPDGTVLVEITGFTIRRLADASILGAAPRLTAAEVEFENGAVASQPLSAADERLAHLLTQGIRTEEGADAFQRALALNEPQVIVSSVDLDALVHHAENQARETMDVQAFDRPELDSDFVAPETEIERTLAGFWSELLGVSNVGVEDSFFDLGGHSLIAVRLFAKVRKAFRVDFPISILFEAPTIRACAALIAEETGQADPASASAPANGQAPAAPPRRFRHIVPMHDGDGGPRQPFFLVAGMFGNVLNLRHLANLLGADRPFFGLQARGLYGDAAPHGSIEEAAADYIAEIRQVQPEGPYMLGGFSGGGIIAYEIAHQLEAAGEKISLIAMLDTPLPQRRALSWRDRLMIQVQQLRADGLRYPLIWARRRIAWEISRRQQVEETEDTHSFHNAEIESAFYSAIAAYQMRPWDGRLVLYRPPLAGKWTVSGGTLVNGDRAYVFHDNEWGLHVPSVEVREVPGDHDSMVLEPNVRVLAARMRADIEKAEAKSAGNGQLLNFRASSQAAE